MLTIEEHLDQLKKSNDKAIKEVEAKHITIDELKKTFLDQSGQSEEFKVDETKYKKLLNEIESLFNAVPDAGFKALLIKHFEESNMLDGKGFESWQNGIKFNYEKEDDLKISYLCSLYDLQLIGWFKKALNDCAPNSRQHKLIVLQNYQNLVEGFFSKTLNIIIYAMMPPSGKLEIKYKDRTGNDQTIKIKSFNWLSKKTSLNEKLLVLESNPTYTELNKIAKACNSGLRNAVAHHSFTLDETNQRITYENGQLQFDDFRKQAIELAEYRIILVNCFHYYSMKCYFESKKLLK